MTGLSPGRPMHGGGELRLRVLSALVLAAGILVTTYVGGLPFRIVWAIAAGLVAYEWLSMTGATKPAASGIAVAACGIMLAWWPYSPGSLAGIAAAAGIAAVLTGLFAKGGWLIGICGQVYALALAALAPLLRDLPEIGLAVILWSFAAVWFTDIAAYFTGRALGGPKLMPSVSPKKTWSGALGGAAAGTLGGVAVWFAAPYFGVTPPAGLGAVALASFAASVLSQAGDLFESAFKRRFGAKDSGHFIPGHGGFMDRLDGYWAVMVFAGALLFLARA